MWVSNLVDIYVLSHPKKQNTTSELLRRMGVSHQVFVNSDWTLPVQHAEWRTDRTWRPIQRDYAIRQYRAFKGHQAIMQHSKAVITMVFEDDVTDMPANFVQEAVADAEKMLLWRGEPLSRMNAVSFHGRNMSPVEHTYCVNNRYYASLQSRVVRERAQEEFLRPLWHTTTTVLGSPLQLKWHEGCLMYAVNASGRLRWAQESGLNGWPCDLFLVNCLDTLVLLGSPVVHGGVSLMTTKV